MTKPTDHNSSIIEKSYNRQRRTMICSVCWNDGYIEELMPASHVMVATQGRWLSCDKCTRYYNRIPESQRFQKEDDMHSAVLDTYSFKEARLLDSENKLRYINEI